MKRMLEGKHIAVLMTDGFEEVEYTEPKAALEKEGAQVSLVSPKDKEVKAWDKDHWSKSYQVDQVVGFADVNDYDALLLPGGVINPDKLRRSQEAVNLVNDFIKSGKPVAAICHGPQMFTEIEAVKGLKLTSFPSVQTDLENAGAEWVDEEVVVDNGIITSRSPGDLPAFTRKMVEEFAEGRH